MKKNIFILVLFVISNLNAQSGFETLFLADKNDSKKIISNYFSPRIKGYLSGLNNGWFYTAKAHRPFGFDFSLNLANVICAKDNEVFNLDNLSSVNLPNGNFNGTTAIGKQKNTPFTVTRNINGQNVNANAIFTGGATNAVFENTTSIPIAQLSVGISNGFDIMLRLTPQMRLNNDNESLNVLGFGIKKEITNWFKKSKNLPLHISILAGYTSMKASYGIENQSLPSGNQSGIEIQNGLSEFSLNSFTFQILSSLEWDRFGFFGSLGYNNGKSNFKTTGSFRGQYQGTTNPEIIAIEAPQDIEFKSSSLSATIGSRINLRYFKIFGSFSVQEFNSTNLGIAFSIK